MDTARMQRFVENFVRSNHMIWFFISIFIWSVITIAIWKISAKMTWQDQGTTELKISMREKIRSEKLRLLLATKSNITEERHFEESREIITVTYEEPDPRSWGGCSPIISLEFDEKNQFILKICIKYNGRKAKKNEVLSITQVKEKIMYGLIHQDLFLNEHDEKGMKDILKEN
jgi:hypothetical protein